MFSDDFVKMLWGYLTTKNRSKLFQRLNHLKHSKKIVDLYENPEIELLMFMLERGDFETAEEIYRVNPHVLTEYDECEGPLHDIMDRVNDRPDLVAWLLDHGANIEERGMNGWTPLHVAAIRGYLGSLCMLLDRGADINSGTELVGYAIDGHVSPLQEAVYGKQLWCVVELVSRGADLDRKDRMSGQTAAELAYEMNLNDIYDVLTQKNDR